VSQWASTTCVNKWQVNVIAEVTWHGVDHAAMEARI